MLTKLDRFGRVIIPKRLREELGINPETKLNISEEGQKIVIELVKDKSPAVNRNGILVFTGKLDSKEKDLIKSDRNNRMRKLLTNRD